MTNSGQSFTEPHAFIGFQKDTPAAVVFQATNCLRSLQQNCQSLLSSSELHGLQRAGVLPPGDLPTDETSQVWIEIVLKLSQFMLLQTAADAALVRLKESKLPAEETGCLMSWYYKYQVHGSISQFLFRECNEQLEMFLQVTTHSPLMTIKELEDVAEVISMDFANFYLHEFDTELDFSNKIGPKFVRNEKNAKPFLIVVQCDSGHLNCDLIACARYRVCDEAIKAKAKNRIQDCHSITHVLFVVRLPPQIITSQFVGFQGHPWVSVHIDDLRPSSDAALIPEQALTATISELFVGNCSDQTLDCELQDLPYTDTEKDSGLFVSAELGKSVPFSLENVDQLVNKEVTPMSLLPEDGDMSLSNESLHMQIEDNESDSPVEEMQTNELPLPSSSGTHIDMPGPEALDLDSHDASAGSEEMEYTKQSQSSLNTKFIPQYYRLLGCVQPAVSMLEDSEENRSIKRIRKLIEIIPKTLPNTLGENSFLEILVKCIYRGLKEREDERTQFDKPWVLMEALNGKNLQSGGTFRNVLARRIDEVITPYFAQIIAHIDQNCNLDNFDPRDETSSLAQFWLSMFNLTGGRIEFTSTGESKTKKKTVRLGNFACKLPFSWFVKSAVDDQCKLNVLRGNTHRSTYVNMVTETLGETEIGDLLNSVNESDVEDFYSLYLHDFVHYVHKSSHKSSQRLLEYSLIADALDAMATDGNSVSSVNPLIQRIASLHFVHGQCQHKILQFGQLVQHRPTLLQSLKNLPPSTRAGKDFILHLCAVQTVLESDQEVDVSSTSLSGLSPPITSKEVNIANVRRWLDHVRLSQNVIDSIAKSNHGEREGQPIIVNIRLTWQRIRVLQIFAEKVFVPHHEVNELVFVIRRLRLTLLNKSDFSRRETLAAVKQLLSNIFKTIKISNLDAQQAIQNSCDQFFIEVVSSLCFGGVDTPEPELINLLLDTVLKNTKTCKLSAYNEPDTTPTIRSFLLQLLLEQKTNQVKGYLKDYFDRSLVVIGGAPDQKLCLLCIQCFENSMHKQLLELSDNRVITEVIQALQEGYEFLKKNNCSVVTLEYLQSVAKVRLSLSVFADQIKIGHVDEDLLEICRDLCSDYNINVSSPTESDGPILYLIRLLVRRYGLPVLKESAGQYPWIVPDGLLGTNEENTFDPFIIYEEQYSVIRNATDSAIFGKDTKELTECVKDNADIGLLALSLYERETLSHSKVNFVEIQAEVLDQLNVVFQNLQFTSFNTINMMRLLLANQQGGPLNSMTVSPGQPPKCRTLSSLVIHTAAVIYNRSNIEILLPFINILQNPSALENAFLPTMAEDILQEVKSSGGGTYYQCPNGHHYLVTECGRPVAEGNCRVCNAKIGGVNHKLHADNKSARTNDTTKTGHDLGDPRLRACQPERERHLSATAVSIVRAIMHSAFIWVSCTSEPDELVDIARVAHNQVTVHDLPQFFWLHLEKDIECLQRSTGRGLDECAIIIHLVLKEMMLLSLSTPLVSAVKDLRSKQARKEWERMFCKSYIDPIILNLDGNIARALNAITSDNHQDHDLLFHLAYEKVKVDESNLRVHLWSYRTRIDLPHLKQTVAQTEDSCKILEIFLLEEPILRATQYLPDLVKLQNLFFVFFDRHFDKAEAEVMTVGEFLQKEFKCKTNSEKRDCEKMIKSLSKAWSLVGQKLRNFNHLPVAEEDLPIEINHQTTMVHLIPTTVGKGRCTTALVHYLVQAHNDFIETCARESASTVWRKHSIPITHLHQCHLMDYEQHLQSIILSHCHYSLTVGKGQDIKYDLPALESHILNRFIYGKPKILLDIPHVAYRKDTFTVEALSSIRQKVPQVAVPQRIQKDILDELRSPENLRKALDVVDTVFGLLSSGGGKPSTGVAKYLESHKMKKNFFSLKAKEHCTIAHVISLWEIISVELAKQLWHNGQEPFEGIPVHYMSGLSPEQTTELNRCLTKFDLDQLLGLLFEYIEVDVKHITRNNQTDFMLVEAIDLYWARTGQIVACDKLFTEEFPDDVNVAQAVATWKHIASYKLN